MAVKTRTSAWGVARYNSEADKTTTGNAFVDVVALDVMLSKSKQFVFKGATNTLSVQILGSVDGGATYPFTEVAAFDVAAGATVVKSITNFYTNLKVQVKPKVNDVHGTLSTAWALASF